VSENGGLDIMTPSYFNGCAPHDQGTFQKPGRIFTIPVSLNGDGG